MNPASINNTSSSYYQFQQSLDQYVYFSPLTMGGASGRAVKIHKDLFLPFFCMVDPSTHDGQAIIRQIENLRTTCTIVRRRVGCGDTRGPKEGGKHRIELDKLARAFHQVLIIKNLHVHYRVSQEDGDKAPSIYIMSIRQVNPDTGGAPGLYEQQSSVRGGVDTKKVDSQQIDGRKVYINGSAQTIKVAMSSARQATNDGNTLLFYCPTRAMDELGVFGSQAKSSATVKTVTELTGLLKKNQKPSKGISWYIEGAGANVLARALKDVSGELTNHEFSFINSIGDTKKLLESLTNKKAKIASPTLTAREATSMFAVSDLQKEQLLKSIGKLPSGKNYSLAARNNIVKSVNKSPSSTKAGTPAHSQAEPSKTFIQLLKTAGVYR